MTKESALQSEDKSVTYAASKKYAELAVWEWAEAHPHVDVTTSKLIILFFTLNLSFTNVIEQYSHPLSTVHSHTSSFHFRSLNMIPFPLLS